MLPTLQVRPIRFGKFTGQIFQYILLENLSVLLLVNMKQMGHFCGARKKPRETWRILTCIKTM